MLRPTEADPGRVSIRVLVGIAQELFAGVHVAVSLVTFQSVC